MTETYKDVRHAIEAKWQAHWRENQIHRAPNPGEPGFDPDRPKSVILDMFPYPSGVGLHIGHPLGYIATDVYARWRRMSGDAVLHAMGFDAFGLPAEQFAIQTGQHPRVTTEQNIANMLSQLARLGLDHDPTRSFATIDPGYVKWTQWIFLQLYNSFYDPTLQWQDALGRTIQGKARPITALAPLLASGAWRLTEKGEPVPADDPAALPHHPLSDDALADALTQARLAYAAEVPVNWCPMLGTVLSNEEVTVDGKSERGDHPVYRRVLKQWMLRITAYAERLYGDLELVDWPDGIIEQQRNWIGPSQGAEVVFQIEGHEDTLRVFTTRPDTLFGVTYMALATEHPLLDQLCLPENREQVAAFCRQAQQEQAKQAIGAEDKPKKGIPTGSMAINPVNGQRVPIYVADYVLMDYGTGAVMGVPGHDQRDFAFASAHDLPIIATTLAPDAWIAENAPDHLAGLQEDAQAMSAQVQGAEVSAQSMAGTLLTVAYRRNPGAFKAAFTGAGTNVNSTSDAVSLDGLDTPAAKTRIIQWLEESGNGRGAKSYKLRDWLFSRQRFWGEPIPIVFDAQGRSWPLAPETLPVNLPDVEDFAPVSVEDPDAPPTPPLSRAADWITVQGRIDEDGQVHLSADGPQRFTRELNTMPNWAGSCWYYLRYFDAKNDSALVAPAVEGYWTGTARNPKAAGAVDLYVGGAEHAVLHLLYARFWHKVLFDLGHVSTPEPFAKLVNQGMITADAYRDSRGVYVDIHDVDMRDQGGKEVPINTKTGEVLEIVPGKMGKRYKNGIPPEEICEQYSADVLRLYEMYMGPIEQKKPWRGNDIVGMMRFAEKVWRLALRTLEADPVDATLDQERRRHQTVQKVGEDIAKLRMNTAIAALIEWVNSFAGESPAPREHLEALVLCLAPFAPHMAEELYHRLAPEAAACHRSVALAPWPSFDPEKTREASREVVIQVNGKRRSAIQVAADAEPALIQQTAEADETLIRFLDGKTPVKVILAPPRKPRIVNFVVKG